MKLFSLLPRRLSHFACNSPRKARLKIPVAPERPLGYCLPTFAWSRSRRPHRLEV